MTGAPPAGNEPAAQGLAVRLAVQLWLVSILCWWVIGVSFSHLWWLVNGSQQRWISICYAWEVPAIGWTGAVLLPYLDFRRLLRRVLEGIPGVGRELAKFPARTAWLVFGTSTVGYLLGALQIDYFTSLPPLEFAKITIQGPALGALFAVAAYLLCENAIQRLGLPADAVAWGMPVTQPLYRKIFSLSIAGAFGAAFPVFVLGVTQSQLQQEELRGSRLLAAVDEAGTSPSFLSLLSGFGTHTYGFVVRRSNGYIIQGTGAGKVIYADGHRDFGPIQRENRGWFPSRDGQHKVVAFRSYPALLPDGDGAVFVAVSPIQDYSAPLFMAARTAAAVAGVAFGLALVLAAMLAENIVRPIERLRIAAAQMARGRLEVAPVGIARGDEVAALARAFNEMAVRVRTDGANLRTAYKSLKRTQAQLVQNERLSAIGRVVSGVANGLNNPLPAMLNLTEDLQHDRTQFSRDHEALEVIADQARRCRTVVRDLLSFVHGHEHPAEPCEISDLIAAAVAAADPVIRETGARVSVTVAGAPLALRVDRRGIVQVIAHLVANAAQAAGRDRGVRLLAAGEGTGWKVEIEDDGAGIPAEVAPRIFEPFFTTRPEGEGTGLGLAVSLGIVERHGGRIDVQPGGGGEGARFTVFLPAINGRSDSAAVTPGSVPPSEQKADVRTPARRRALIVDDERSVRMALMRYLNRQGWEVDQAEDGAEALKILERAPEHAYGVVISDLRMPRRSGIVVHDWMAEHRPDLFARLIVVTGDVASPPVRELLDRTTRPILEKPFELSALAAAVAACTSGTDAATASGPPPFP